MKLTLFLATFLSILLTTSGYAQPGNAANGKQLFAKSSCASACHGTGKFTDPNRKVKNLAKLEAQVRRCDSNLNTNWFDDEILDVTAYLNQSFYKFK